KRVRQGEEPWQSPPGQGDRQGAQAAHGSSGGGEASQGWTASRGARRWRRKPLTSYVLYRILELLAICAGGGDSWAPSSATPWPSPRLSILLRMPPSGTSSRPGSPLGSSSGMPG